MISHDLRSSAPMWKKEKKQTSSMISFMYLEEAMATPGNLIIEGEHLFPVIWKKRLFVFWLNIVEKAEEVDKNKDLVAISKDKWGEHAKVKATITMCWGEYYKGKWTSPKSTELHNPIVIGNHSVFEANKILLFARKEKNPPLSER